MVVEAAFYLPILILAYFGFIVMALYITQRVALDASVSRVALEASAYLADEPKIGQTHSFSGNTEKFYMDPYRRLIGKFTSKYGSLGSKSAFDKRVEKKVREYATGFKENISATGDNTNGGSGAGAINVKVTYKDCFFFGELTIDAQQSFVLPIDLSLFNISRRLTFNSTAKTMVFKPAALINDVDLVFDVLRFFGADVRKVRDLVSGLPEKIKGLI